MTPDHYVDINNYEKLVGESAKSEVVQIIDFGKLPMLEPLASEEVNVLDVFLSLTKGKQVDIELQRNEYYASTQFINHLAYDEYEFLTSKPTVTTMPVQGSLTQVRFTASAEMQVHEMQVFNLIYVTYSVLMVIALLFVFAKILLCPLKCCSFNPANIYLINRIFKKKDKSGESDKDGAIVDPDLPSYFCICSK